MLTLGSLGEGYKYRAAVKMSYDLYSRQHKLNISTHAQRHISYEMTKFCNELLQILKCKLNGKEVKNTLFLKNRGL